MINVPTQVHSQIMVEGCKVKDYPHTIHQMQMFNSYWDIIENNVRKASSCKCKMPDDLFTDFLNNLSDHLLNIVNVYQLHHLADEASRHT